MLCFLPPAQSATVALVEVCRLNTFGPDMLEFATCNPDPETPYGESPARLAAASCPFRPLITRLLRGFRHLPYSEKEVARCGWQLEMLIV